MSDHTMESSSPTPSTPRLSSIQRVMATRIWTMNGLGQSKARILPRRFFWTWEPAGIKL